MSIVHFEGIDVTGKDTNILRRSRPKGNRLYGTFPLEQGLEPATSWSQIYRLHHSATTGPYSKRITDPICSESNRAAGTLCISDIPPSVCLQDSALALSRHALRITWRRDGIQTILICPELQSVMLCSQSCRRAFFAMQ